MIVNGIECPLCHDRIWSRYRHDWRTCKCGAVFVDGGRDYLRYGTRGDAVSPLKIVEIDTDSEVDSEVAKKAKP